MQVVEHEQIDAPFAVIVGLHIRFNRRRREQRALGTLDRNTDLRERRDVLTLAVLEQLRSRPSSGLVIGLPSASVTTASTST
jgi:hypothetical protein